MDSEFSNLTPKEQEYINLQIKLAQNLREADTYTAETELFMFLAISAILFGTILIAVFI